MLVLDAERVWQARVAAGLGLVALEQRAGLSRVTRRRVCRGRPVRERTAARVAAALGVRLVDLLAEPDGAVRSAAAAAAAAGVSRAARRRACRGRAVQERVAMKIARALKTQMADLVFEPPGGEGGRRVGEPRRLVWTALSELGGREIWDGT